jgi:hypothetical protein
MQPKKQGGENEKRYPFINFNGGVSFTGRHPRVSG